MTVHGDDFASTGTEASLRWLDGKLSEAYELKTKYLGPDVARGHVSEMRVLNRVIAWSEDGITYEPDQRHAELIIKDMGLSGSSNGVVTPGGRKDDANMKKKSLTRVGRYSIGQQ